VINRVRNTTLHSYHLNAITNGNINVFNFDVWHSLDVAKELFPNEPVRQSLYAHARVGLGVSALMDLSDGTLDLALRDTHEYNLAA
jgi:hypothetical protein